MKKILMSCLLTGGALTSLNNYAQDQLEEVFITGSRTEIPLRQVGTSATIIDSMEIELKGVPTLLDLLRSEAGISGSTAGGLGKVSALRIRGEEGYRTLIMIDGIEVSDPTGTQVGPHVQHLTVSSEIEKIEILRGPQGFIYGADAGGVINIFTRSGEDGLNGKVSAEAGSYNTTNLNGYIAGGNTRVDGFASIANIRSEGFSAFDKSQDPTEDKDGYENTTLHTKLGWNIIENLRAQFVLRNTEATTEFDRCWNSQIGDFGGTTHNCEGYVDQFNSRLSMDYNLDAISVSGAISRTEIERENFADNNRSYFIEGSIEKAEVLSNIRLEETVNLLIGGDLETETSEPEFGNKVARDQLGIFTELQGGFADSFFITAGARYDDNDDFGKHTSMRVSGAYVVETRKNHTLKFRSSYGTGFRAPSLFEVNNNNTSEELPELTEEHSKGYDLGIEFYTKNNANIILGYFDQTITDAITYNTSIGVWGGYDQEVGDSKSKGIELSAEYPVVENVILRLNYTYNDTETPEGNQRIRRPKNSGNLGIQWNTQKTQLLLSYRVSQDAIDYPGDIELEDYSTVNVSFEYKVLDNLDLFARIENILNEEYQEVTGYNTSDTAAYAGVRFQF